MQHQYKDVVRIFFAFLLCSCFLVVAEAQPQKFRNSAKWKKIPATAKGVGWDLEKNGFSIGKLGVKGEVRTQQGKPLLPRMYNRYSGEYYLVHKTTLSNLRIARLNIQRADKYFPALQATAESTLPKVVPPSPTPTPLSSPIRTTAPQIVTAPTPTPVIDPSTVVGVFLDPEVLPGQFWTVQPGQTLIRKYTISPSYLATPSLRVNLFPLTTTMPLVREPEVRITDSVPGKIAILGHSPGEWVLVLDNGIVKRAIAVHVPSSSTAPAVFFWQERSFVVTVTLILVLGLLIGVITRAKRRKLLAGP